MIFFLVCANSLMANDTVYIDPSQLYNGVGDGTLRKPFNSWSQISFKPGKTYCQKRGTSDTIEHIFLDADNITLDGYGMGKKPVLFCKTENRKNAISCWKLSGIKIKNLEIVAPQATSCIYFNHGNTNHVIDSCIVHGSQWGIRITSGNNSGHKILNTEVYDIADDGIFIQDAQKIEVAFCYIHHVNKKWKSPETSEKIAPGDGIQLSKCNYWHVHHNLIDRRSSGNKFCFISNNPDQTHGVLEHNMFYCPAIKGSCVYFHDGSGIQVRYNYFIGNQTSVAIYHRSSYLEVYYNVFNNFKTAIVSLNKSPCIVTNNTFHNVKNGLNGENFKSVNNLFDIKNSLQTPYYKVNKIEKKNNHYTSGNFIDETTIRRAVKKGFKNENFKLNSDSPCIDKGVPTKYTHDILGNKVPNGIRPDIGAYEYY